MSNVEIVRDEGDKSQFDASRVDDLDPNFYYRWARVDVKDIDGDLNLKKHMLHGYEVVQREGEKHVLDDTTRIKKGVDVDRVIRWGDLILIRTPKANYERRMAAERARIVRQVQSVTQAYKENVRRVTGVQRGAFEDHKDTDKNMRTVTSREEETMTPAQMQEALKIAQGETTEDE